MYSQCVWLVFPIFQCQYINTNFSFYCYQGWMFSSVVLNYYTHASTSDTALGKVATEAECRESYEKKKSKTPVLWRGSEEQWNIPLNGGRSREGATTEKAENKVSRGRWPVAQNKQSAEDSDASDEDTSQTEAENSDDSDSHDEGMPSLHHFCHNVYIYTYISQYCVDEELICQGFRGDSRGETEEGQVKNWKSCDGCWSWFHYQCAGFRRKPTKNSAFYCSDCTKKIVTSL